MTIEKQLLNQVINDTFRQNANNLKLNLQIRVFNLNKSKVNYRFKINSLFNIFEQ